MRQLFDDPLRTVGVRDYHPEDDLRRVHWKATARRQALQSRVYEPSTAHNLIILLNVATLTKHWHGYIPSRMERVVSVAASIAAYASEQRWPVGILTNGVLPESDQAVKVLPGRSPAQLTRIMEALASVSPIATQHIEDLIRQESPKLPWGSTLVVVTALVSEPLKATLANLHASGRRLALVSLEPVDPADPMLRGILVRTVSGGMPEGEVVALSEQPQRALWRPSAMHRLGCAFHGGRRCCVWPMQVWRSVGSRSSSWSLCHRRGCCLPMGRPAPSPWSCWASTHGQRWPRPGSGAPGWSAWCCWGPCLF